jgi:hypothetical protein
VKTELYNLKHDRAEKHDVADVHPEVLVKLEALMQSSRTVSEEFAFPTLDNMTQ